MSTQPSVQPTQVRHPWRATARTVFAALIGFAPMAPVIYHAATGGEPDQATGAAAVGLAVAGGVTRVIAIPAVDAWLRRFVPFLATEPRP